MLVAVILVAACSLVGAQQTVSLRDVRLERHGQGISISTQKGNGFSTSTSLTDNTVLEDCSSSNEVCLQWPSGNTRATLKITKANDSCFQYSQRDEGSKELSYCFEYGADQWFGGAERTLQEWPVQVMKINKEGYVTTQNNNQAIAEPYWVSSAGTSYYVYPHVALFIDSNTRVNGSMCFIAQNDRPYNSRNESVMEFEWCFFDDPVTAHKYNVDNKLGKPTGIPDETMIKYPIYSTWARYKRDINASVITAFANEILENRFPVSQIDIDDKWEPCYGAAIFDTNKFPDIRGLTDSLHALGIRTTLWTTTFINQACQPYFTDAKNAGRLVSDQNGNVISIWWNGIGASVDFTNATTAQWWSQRLRDLLNTSGIDSYKFDAGETGWLPQLPQFDDMDPNLYPDLYPIRYMEVVSEFGNLIEARVGKRTQKYPVFIRMIDKDSRWGLDNGLKSLVTTLLQMNIAGYPFALPDMIGGNVYGLDKVSKELFIRWLQANTFMPTMQFSLVPWDYDDETVEISRKFVELHATYAPQIIAAAKRAVSDGTPINPPVWWIAPTDTEAHKISDEYLLGEDILVAPVMDEGATQRNIYLPAGTWRDLTRGGQTNVTGPTWLMNYPVALGELPYFQKLV